VSSLHVNVWTMFCTANTCQKNHSKKSKTKNTLVFLYPLQVIKLLIVTLKRTDALKIPRNKICTGNMFFTYATRMRPNYIAATAATFVFKNILTSTLLVLYKILCYTFSTHSNYSAPLSFSFSPSSGPLSSISSSSEPSILISSFSLITGIWS
jgi:hypothetical protein